MKKILLVVTVLLVFACNIVFFSAAPVANAADAGVFFDDEFKYDSDWEKGQFLEYFVNNFSNRKGGTAGETAAAKYIAQIFEAYDNEYPGEFKPHNESLSVSGINRYLQNFSFSYNGNSYNSNNVIITKKAKVSVSNPKTVIIGAHYDNVYSLPRGKTESDYKFQGAYDNGTGIAVLIDLLDRLSKTDALDYNITFIAFGAEEYYMGGSSHYVDTMNYAPEDILLMINLDVVGAGDYLYLFCDDVKTQHQDFLFEIAKKRGISLKAAPFDKIVTAGQMLDSMYYHIGLLSDNLPFLLKGINCAFFFTYNWEHGLSESSDNVSIIHTENDNFSTLKEKHENYQEYMNNVSDIVYYSLAADGFESIMVESFKHKFDYSIFSNKVFLLCIGLGALLLVCAFVYFQYQKFKKEKITEIPIPSHSSEKIAVFGEDFEDRR